MIGPRAAYRQDPEAFEVQTWANVAGAAVVVAFVVLLIVLVRPAAPAAVEAIVEAS